MSGLAWLPLGFAKFTRSVMLKKSTNALSRRLPAKIEPVPGAQVGLEEPGTEGAVPFRLVALDRVGIGAGPRVVASRERLGDRPVAIGVDVAVGQAERRTPRARATQLKFRPPVFGMSAVPLTTRLWR